MRLARRGLAFAALATALLTAGCGGDDDNGPADVAIDLTGNYTLQTFEQGAGSALVEVTGATGTFDLTASTYTAVLVIPGVAPINDAGTYTATGSTANGVTSGDFSQTSTAGGAQATGTFTYTESTGVLVLSTTVNGLNQRITLLKD